MGSNSRGKDGEGTSGVKKDEENYEYEQDMNFLPPEALFGNTNGFTDPLIIQPQVRVRWSFVNLLYWRNFFYGILLFKETDRSCLMLQFYTVYPLYDGF